MISELFDYDEAFVNRRASRNAFFLTGMALGAELSTLFCVQLSHEAFGSSFKT